MPKTSKILDPENNILVRIKKLNLKRFVRPAARILSCAGILLTFAVVLYYILYPARGEFHADCTDTLMWAVASHESGQIISDTFNYACFLPFGGQLLMLPFINAFGGGIITHTIGMCLFLLIFSVSLIMLTRAMKWNITWTFITTFSLLLTVCTSEKLREIFWGHIIYYSLGILFMLIGLNLVFKVLENSENIKKNKLKLIIYTVVLFVWFTLCSLNQLESFTIFVVPAAAGVLGEAFFSYSEKVKCRKNAVSVILFVIIAIAAGLGYILGSKIIGDNVAGYATAFSNFSEMAKWNENLHTFFTAWLSLLGVTIKQNQPIADFTGMITLIRIIYGFILIVAPFIITFKFKKQSRPVRILIITHWTMTALIMMGYVFGLLSAANWRLSPIICTSVLMTVALCQWIYTNTSFKRNIAIMLIPMMIICCVSVVDILKMHTKERTNVHLYRLMEVLENNDLTYGYATFWNANCITVLSNEQVKVRNIAVSDMGDCTKSMYQSDENWYKDQPGQENYFIILTQDELSKVNTNAYPIISDAQDIYYCGNYAIAVFNHNIFS
ncbi:MAG: hypothetical protein Q4F95_05415 [Oscillospiraceae bacterium]|nr:hypothetical protein [Oscillospiraceae bacterium]